MSKSRSTNTNQHQRRLVLALMTGGLVAGCGGGNDPWHIDPDGYDGLGEQTFELLTDPCVIDASHSTMTLQVRAGETLYLSLRAADGKVIADGQTSSHAECAVPSTYTISITEAGTTGSEKVFLDYINGPFAVGATVNQVATAGITMALGAGSTLVVRGSSGADKTYLGSTYTSGVLSHSWVNVNGDTSPDVRFDGATDVLVSTGVGADIISADGGNGTTGVALDQTITFSAYGGPDADTLTGGKGQSLLDGGDGDDKFIQTLTSGPDNMVGGKGTDTVDYSVRTAAVKVTVCSYCANSDVCNCVQTNTSCRLAADGVQTSCNQGATTTRNGCSGAAAGVQSACHGTADQTQSGCHTAADGARTTCYAACYTAADNAQTTCNDAADTSHTGCVNGCSGDATCIAGCDSTQTSDLAVCDSAHTSDRAACDSTQTSDRAACDSARTNAYGICDGAWTSAYGVCDGAYTTANGLCTTAYNNTTQGCTSAHTSAWGVCDGAQTTCQTSCSQPLCSVCTGDDGGTTNSVSEGDTVNDNIEVVLGSKGNDTISAVFAVCSDEATTPTVKCTLKGNEGDDSLVGSTHVDLIDGGAGNDTLQGGLGNDTLIGGAGTDTVSYADRSVAVSVSLDSTRWVSGQNGAASENDTITDVENLIGGSGNDFLRGNSSANMIQGGTGDDTIEGGTGNDALYGDAGDDRLYGGAGNDMLTGGAGTDTLTGGDGDDFIDSTDSAGTTDTISCDGANALGGATGTVAGTADALVKDSGESRPLTCEL